MKKGELLRFPAERLVYFSEIRSLAKKELKIRPEGGEKAGRLLAGKRKAFRENEPSLLRAAVE